jgi:hypothetical protein
MCLLNVIQFCIKCKKWVLQFFSFRFKTVKNMIQRLPAGSTSMQSSTFCWSSWPSTTSADSTLWVFFILFTFCSYFMFSAWIKTQSIDDCSFENIQIFKEKFTDIRNFPFLWMKKTTCNHSEKIRRRDVFNVFVLF